jgi:hypothetical protein
MLVGGPCAGWDTVDVLHNRISMHSSLFDDVDVFFLYIIYFMFYGDFFQANRTHISTKRIGAFKIFTLVNPSWVFKEFYFISLALENKTNRNAEAKMRTNSFIIKS